jgi:hypothetical protein
MTFHLLIDKYKNQRFFSFRYFITARKDVTVLVFNFNAFNVLCNCKFGSRFDYLFDIYAKLIK